MRTIDDMVRQEVIYCVSALVSDLSVMDDEQAMDLCCPLEDYESAAIEAGWAWDSEAHCWSHSLPDMPDAMTAEEACEYSGIEPYDREIYEHWIVSDWLAEKLEAKGERIDSDFHGLTVWGRTTTGQGIAMDSVIEEIYRDVLNAQD